MVSNYIIQLLYGLGFFVISLSGILLILDGSEAWVGLGLLTIGNLVWRVLCEGWILFFRIHNTVESINQKLDKAFPSEPSIPNDDLSEIS